MIGSEGRCCQCGCGEKLGNQPNQKWASPACRQAAKKVKKAPAGTVDVVALPVGPPRFSVRLFNEVLEEPLWTLIRGGLPPVMREYRGRGIVKMLVKHGGEHVWMELQDLPRDLWLPFVRNEPVGEPEAQVVEVKPAWKKAVSIAQIEWAKRQLRCLDAGGKVDQPRGVLVALAETNPTGLPERAADKRSVKRPTKKAKEA